MLEVGSIVGDRFRIERLLGQGGMGVVAVATHLQLDQQVAIKVLHEAMSNDADVVARLLREAQASARLRSDHVCKVFDVGRFADGAPYIVMELLDGSDLQRVVNDGPLPVATAVDYVLQACVAVAEAHALGIVHRDLKPANLFLTRRLDGSPLIKVLDFGIAKAPAAGEFKITRTSMVMGSPGYMSPEQLRSAHDVDARSDIWALGVILYELVSGRLPFRGNSITELAVKVTVDPPEPLELDAPEFTAVVFRCLEKSAERRYQTVAELAAALAPLGGDVAGRSAMLIAALAGAATAPGASALAMAPRTAATALGSGVAPSRSDATPPPRSAVAVVPRGATAPSPSSAAPLRPVLGNATTLQTAAAESTGDRIPVARRSRAGLVIGGVAIAAVVAAVALFATRRDDAASKDSTSSSAGAPPASASGRGAASSTSDRTGAADSPGGVAGGGAAGGGAASRGAAGDNGVTPGAPGSNSAGGDAAGRGTTGGGAAGGGAASSGAAGSGGAAGGGAASSGAAGSGATGASNPGALRAKLRELAASHDWSAVLEVAELDRGDPEIATIVRDARQAYLAQQSRAIDAQVKLGNCARAKEIATAAHKVVADDATLAARARACKPLPAPTRPTTTASATPSQPPIASQPPAASLPPGHTTEPPTTSQPPPPHPTQPSGYPSEPPGGPSEPPGPASEAGSDAEGGVPDLADAQSAIQRGDWSRALSLAQSALRRMPRSPIALRIGVISACHLHDEKTARSLLRRVPPGRQRALRQQARRRTCCCNRSPGRVVTGR